MPPGGLNLRYPRIHKHSRAANGLAASNITERERVLLSIWIYLLSDECCGDRRKIVAKGTASRDDPAVGVIVDCDVIAPITVEVADSGGAIID